MTLIVLPTPEAAYQAQRLIAFHVSQLQLTVLAGNVPAFADSRMAVWALVAAISLELVLMADEGRLRLINSTRSGNIDTNVGQSREL